VGYVPDLIRTARTINDGMPDYIKNEFISALIKNKINPVDCKVLIMGFTFKENCPDLRNTKVYDLYIKLVDAGFDVEIYDPWAKPKDVFKEYGIKVIDSINKLSMNDVGILTVGHEIIMEELKSEKLYFRENYIMDFKSLI
jgi:UDP-N-acetyl-D-galactosamine dehydrogenase